MKPFFDMSMLAALSYLGIFFLVGIVLRYKIKIFQKWLLPASLIGGIVGMVFSNTTGFYGTESIDFKAISYHSFALTFMSISLAAGSSSMKGHGKDILKGSMWLFFMYYLLLGIQVLFTTGGVFLLKIFYGDTLPESLSFLASQAFQQGPGQTVSSGLLWEKFGVPHMSDVGLSFATIGILVAFIVGIPMARWAIRKNLCQCAPKELDEEIRVGIMKPDSKHIAGYHVTHPMNAESLAVIFSAVLLTWLSSYLLADFIAKNSPPAIGGTMWGFLYLIGTAMGFIVRFLFDKSGLGRLIDDSLLRRVSGLCLELVLLSTFIGISIQAINYYIIPVIFISAIATVVTFAGCMWFGARTEGASIERTIFLFGTNTGTTATGLLLLRLVDGEYKTTVPIELALSNLPCIGGGLVVGVLVQGVVVYGWTFWATFGGFLAYGFACFLGLALFKLISKKKAF